MPEIKAPSDVELESVISELQAYALPFLANAMAVAFCWGMMVGKRQALEMPEELSK